jgi:hypothetical protein
MGLNRLKPQERVETYIFLHTVLEIMYMGFNRDMCVCTGLVKGRCIHLKRCVISRSYNKLDISRFVSSCVSLSGPLSVLWEP